MAKIEGCDCPVCEAVYRGGRRARMWDAGLEVLLGAAIILVIAMFMGGIALLVMALC